jgi:hypothetical protein
MFGPLLCWLESRRKLCLWNTAIETVACLA